MSDLKLSFVNEESAGDVYSLVCKNDSPGDWYFYVYQKLPQQPSDVFSLAWFASPIKLAQGSTITFDWTIDYSFVWGRSGIVQPGVNYNAGGDVPCSLQGDNQTTFSAENNTPRFSTPVSGGQAGSLTINEDASVPNLVYSTGIGMSGQGTFVQQALANSPQVYTPEPTYFIAAGSQIQMGQVLAQTITGSGQVTFPQNVFTMYATLSDQQLWEISETAPTEAVYA